LSFQILDNENNEMGKRLDGRLFKNFGYPTFSNLRILTIMLMAILILASYKSRDLGDKILDGRLFKS
jgi:hypothetical protein